MPRAYSPRMSTTLLVARILARPGIAGCRTLPPTRWRPTMLRITLDSCDPNGRPVYSDFTLPDARAWLAEDIA
jgi:hypothetical protein